MSAKIFYGVPRKKNSKADIERFKERLRALDKKLAEIDVRSEKERK